jgi:ribonuclease P protein component
MPRPTAQPLLFRKRHRLSRDLDYKAVFDAKVRKHRGPLTVFAKPNTLPNHRLGLSIGKRIGNAVTRNRLKRRLREAFRQHIIDDSNKTQATHDSPITFDFIVTARPHPPMKTDDYAALLTACAAELTREWQRRARRTKRNANESA